MKTRLDSQEAESIGQPIIEIIIDAHTRSDYDLLANKFPELTKGITLDIFKEAVEELNLMGKVSSIEFLGLFNKADEQVLLWNMRYERREEDILWHLFLSESESELKPTAICII